MTPESLTAVFLLGFFGGVHCLGMCGGIAAALSFAIPKTDNARRTLLVLFYNVGRIGSYTLIGAFAGLAGSLFTSDGLPVLRTIAGIILILMGLYLADWWKILSYLERAGAGLWRKLQPLGQRLMPVRTVPAALLFGCLWGWLPCGLVYPALAYGAVQGSWHGSAAVMLAFGLGTLPAVFTGGLASVKINQGLRTFARQRMVKTVVAMAYILFGAWIIWAALPVFHAGEKTHHDHSHHFSWLMDS